MMSLLIRHTFAAARGDGLRPELLTATTQENPASEAGKDGVSLHAGIERLDGLIGSREIDPGLRSVGRLKRQFGALR
ncbi:hypothetical protein HT585_21555 [Ensifer sp. HO-A22]|uniref:Uncharacterized protein n=1 Tax=Ensifer oleiphilus TaxID=2742698 RepID=A0A7Y6Q9B3_9HYPH|nr:hypothetical protein [Ensifer oleiphilus]NVD41458.1 hypothetical protein [Ensifer oleiphilus]